MLNRDNEPVLPSHDSVPELCNRMADFFQDKIKAIHSSLDEIRNTSGLNYNGEQCAATASQMGSFKLVTDSDIMKIVKSSPSKSCCLDPVPTAIVKECLDVLVPIITRIVNQSFETCKVPFSFKIAAVTPLIKKLNLIPDILKNFRPLSNLPFLSKILEKVAAKQMINYANVNELREVMQSAYRQFCSTETAML